MPGPDTATAPAAGLEHASGAASIAVVIPCRNAEKWLARTIASVLDQGYPRLEVIVIDDGSTDRSRDVAASFGPRVTLESQRPSGVSAARNRGLARATGDYVLFLDADDLLLDGFLHVVGRHLKAGRYDMLIAPLIVQSPDDRRLVDVLFGLDGWDAWFGRFVEGALPQTGQVVWSTAFVRRIGGWNETLQVTEDLEIGLRASLHRPRILPLTDAFATYNWHAGPERLMFQGIGKRIEAELAQLVELEDRILEVGGDPARQILARRYYNVAALAFREGHAVAGRRALGRARALGLKGHPGTALHRLAAALLGLPTKQRISRVTHRIRQASRNG